LYSAEFKKFNIYKHFREAFKMLHKTGLKYTVSENMIAGFISCNPEYFETYMILGNYYKDQSDKERALKYYNLALTKEITTVQDREAIEKGISEVGSSIAE
jgi:isopenicillin-N N-acyltransferase like protein